MSEDLLKRHLAMWGGLVLYNHARVVSWHIIGVHLKKVHDAYAVIRIL